MPPARQTRRCRPGIREQDAGSNSALLSTIRCDPVVIDVVKQLDRVGDTDFCPLLAHVCHSIPSRRVLLPYSKTFRPWWFPHPRAQRSTIPVELPFGNAEASRQREAEAALTNAASHVSQV
jgi:hypothetical protein